MKKVSRRLFSPVESVMFSDKGKLLKKYKIVFYTYRNKKAISNVYKTTEILFALQNM